MKRLVPVLLVSLVILGVFGLAACGGNRVTLEQYNQIQTGMTFAEVRDIFGSSGTQDSISWEGTRQVEIRSWSGRGSSGATVVITFYGNGLNREITNIEQTGLR